MKKLMILSLVMAMGTFASASLVLDIVGNEVSVLLPEGSDNLIGYDLLVRVSDGVLDSSGVNLNPSGKTWHLAPSKTADLETPMQFAFQGADITLMGGTGLAAGNLVLSGLTFSGADVFTIELATFGVVTIGGQTYADGYVFDSVVIPEPMTMGLLGVGALFLRRRK